MVGLLIELVMAIPKSLSDGMGSRQAAALVPYAAQQDVCLRHFLQGGPGRLFRHLLGGRQAVFHQDVIGEAGHC